MDKEYKAIYIKVWKLISEIKKNWITIDVLNINVERELHWLFTLYEAIETRNIKK